MQILHFVIIPFQSLIHLSACEMVCLYEMPRPFYKTSITSVSRSVCLWEREKKNVCSLSSPPLSQHVGLCVCEDSSCILRSRSRGKHLPLSPCSPSSSSSCPHLTLMAVGFLMRKWVSLCSVSIEGLQGGEGGRAERCTGAKHIPRLWSSNASLVGWDRGGGAWGVGVWGQWGSTLSVNIAMPSFSLQRAKQANRSILPVLLPLPHCEQAVCITIIDKPVQICCRVFCESKRPL